MNARTACGAAAMLAAILLAAAGAAAGTPPWVESLRQIPARDYPPETNAVVLLDEGRTVVTESGEIKSYFRIAYRILTREALGLAWVRLPFDAETKISDIKAWNLKSDGVVHETSGKDATETQFDSSGSILFEDTRTLLLMIPQVDVGSIVAMEFERRHRPYILQDTWIWQGVYPVVQSRFEVELPSGWELRWHSVRHPEIKPAQTGNRWTWELRDIAAIPTEEGMPPVASLTAELAVLYFPGADQKNLRANSLRDWDDFARWSSALFEPRWAADGSVTEMARKLATDRAMAEFVQKEIRYVAIEIGIGGFQPHFAAETFRNRYGDCKDKVTLLTAMLKSLGRNAFPVLINTSRRPIVQEFPSQLYFNHMIAALPLAEGDSGGQAAITHPELGRLLLFDPTDDRVPFGQLPSVLQGTRAVLINGNRSFTIDTPVAAASTNRLLRSGRFRLSPAGQLSGRIQEMYWGQTAAAERGWLEGETHDRWMRGAENATAPDVPGVIIRKLGVDRLKDVDPLIESYEFEVPYFADTAGELLLFRPAAIGAESLHISAKKARAHPYTFGHLRSRGMDYEFTLPEGYTVAELPADQEKSMPFGSFRMKVTQQGNVVKCIATLEIKQMSVAAADVDALRDFYRHVERSMEAAVILKKAPAAAAIQP